MNSNRRIAHLDMDAFFASVEMLHYPELKGLAVVVGGRGVAPPPNSAEGQRAFSRLGDYVGRGVVTTSTYAARALGVYSGMGLMRSAQLAPEAILLPANFDAYRHYSRCFKTAVREIAPEIEDRGIDEIYIDLSQHPDDSRTVALQIKKAVYEATGLICSIGIAPNKLLAKIGSDLDKPDGLTLLTPADIPARIWPLRVGKINGIGPRAQEKLGKLNINTIGELAAAVPELLTTHFGTLTGLWLHQAAHGIDDRPVTTRSEPRSISRETTFQEDLHVQHNRATLTEALTQLCQGVSRDLERKHYRARTIGIKLRFANFHTLTRDLTLPHTLQDSTEILHAARECLKRVTLNQKIRLLGIRASKLSPNNMEENRVIQPELPF